MDEEDWDRMRDILREWGKAIAEEERRKAERERWRAEGYWDDYMDCLWGDSIEGTKEQLQALGLGVGRAFPGEPNGPARRLRVTDPRGFPTEIERRYRSSVYHAHIRFPHVPPMPDPWRDAWKDAVEIAPGVRRATHQTADVYEGTAEALALAGIVDSAHFPGMPGMRKSRVTIYANGEVASGPASGNEARAKARQPGARHIERCGKSSRFRVYVLVSEAESEARTAADRAEHQRWEQIARTIPRPPRLMPVYSEQRDRTREALVQASQDQGFQEMLSRVVSGAGAVRR